MCLLKQSFSFLPGKQSFLIKKCEKAKIIGSNYYDFCLTNVACRRKFMWVWKEQKRLLVYEFHADAQILSE